MADRPALWDRLRYQWKRIRPAYRYRMLRNLLLSDQRLWRGGLQYELDFWRDALTNPENPHYEGIKVRFVAGRPLRKHLIDLLDIPPGGTVNILDVGAGPVEELGTVWEGRTVRITPTDALGDAYNRLLDEIGLEPPIRTQQCHAEQLGERFPPDSFDLVCAFNALDHSYNPMAALQQAMVVLKPGGVLFLRHNVNEGKRNYTGLHQWNFCEDGGKFVIWNLRQRFVVADHLPMLADIHVNLGQQKINMKTRIKLRDTVDVVIHKKK